MEGSSKKQTIRIFGLLLLIIMFTMQSQASIFKKKATDLSVALEQSESEMKATIQVYEVGQVERRQNEIETFVANFEPPQSSNPSETVELASAPTRVPTNY